MRLEIFEIGPERRFHLRLITRSWVRDARGRKLPCRSRPLSTRWDTLFWRQETSYQLHRLTVTFQVASLLATLTLSLNAIKASKSKLVEAQSRKKWRMKRTKAKSKLVRVGFAIIALQLIEILEESMTLMASLQAQTMLKTDSKWLLAYSYSYGWVSQIRSLLLKSS